MATVEIYRGFEFQQRQGTTNTYLSDPNQEAAEIIENYYSDMIETLAARFLAQSATADILAASHYTDYGEAKELYPLAPLSELVINFDHATPFLSGDVDRVVKVMAFQVENEWLNASFAATIFYLLRHDLANNDAAYFKEIKRLLVSYSDEATGIEISKELGTIIR